MKTIHHIQRLFIPITLCNHSTVAQ